MKSKAKRNSLAKKIAGEESDSRRQLLARHGDIVPQLHIVQHWADRFDDKAPRRDERGWLQIAVRGVTEAERLAMGDLLIGKLATLRSDWFQQIARAIRVYSSPSKRQDSIRLRLTNLHLSADMPGMTREQIAGRIGYKGELTKLGAILRDLGMSYRRTKGGRPRLKN